MQAEPTQINRRLRPCLLSTPKMTYTACIRLHSDCKPSRHNRSVDAIMSAQFPEGDLQPALGYILTASRADTTDPLMRSCLLSSPKFPEGDLQPALGYIPTASRADTTDPLMRSCLLSSPKVTYSLHWVTFRLQAEPTQPIR
ncbi:hypothetical protein J6590_003190 [Homalodisca vitripennis]|nr:hypothetical protein J6590_003190 [Homalodisca vitripennis]